MSIASNPESAEGLSEQTLQEGFAIMNKTIRLSNNLPAGAAYKQYTSVADFDAVTRKFSSNVVHQLNSIFMRELPSVKFKVDDREYNAEILINVNDCILDRIYNNIDCMKKGVEPNQQTDSKVIAPGGFHKPIITTIQVGATKFTTAKNITRPQLLFKDAVDNTSAIWVPKILEKPHNIKPLALELLYDNKGNPTGYAHPYRHELFRFEPRDEWLVVEDLPPLPPPLEETNYTFIDTEKQLNELINHMQTVEEIGVDLEHHSYRSYQGFTCLIQITTPAGDFIIDALAVREHLHILNEIFANPNILKIFHGADMDVVWLQKDFGVYVVGLFDTHQATRALGHCGGSLAALLKKYCGLTVDKSHQLSDWRLRPLTEDMVRYARTDTHYLLYIWRCLRQDLVVKTEGGLRVLRKVFDNSRKVCLRRYQKPVLSDDSHLAIYERQKKRFNSRQMAALQKLYRWREEEARVQDESPMYLIPNHLLMTIAEALPLEVQGITALCNPVPPFVKQNLNTIHRMLLSCRDLPLVPPPDFFEDDAARFHLPTPEYDVHDVTNNGQENHENEHVAACETKLITKSVVKEKVNSESYPDVTLFTEKIGENKLKPRPSLRQLAQSHSPYVRHKKYRALLKA